MTFELSLNEAATAVALAYAGSPGEDPQVTDYLLRLVKRIEELEAQNKQLGDMYHQRGNDIALLKRQARKARASALREAAELVASCSEGPWAKFGFEMRDRITALIGESQ